MLAVIIGGGRGGSYLARDLQSQGYQVKVVDRRPEVVARLRQEIGGDVICGDGSSPQTLEQVGVAGEVPAKSLAGNRRRDGNAARVILSRDRLRTDHVESARAAGSRRTARTVRGPGAAWRRRHGGGI